MRLNISKISLLIVWVGSIVVVGLFVAVLNPFAEVACASALSVSEFLGVSVLLVVAVNEASVKVRGLEAPPVSCAVAVHLAFNTSVLMLVRTLSLGVSELGF